MGGVWSLDLRRGTARELESFARDLRVSTRSGVVWSRGPGLSVYEPGGNLRFVDTDCLSIVGNRIARAESGKVTRIRAVVG